MNATPPPGEWPTYTYRQVDRLLDLSQGTARRWINGYSRNRRLYLPIVRPDKINTAWVTWDEFLETRLMANYRDIDNVPISHIRQVVSRLRELTGVKHPLTRWSIYIRPQGRELLFDAQGPSTEDEPFRFVERMSDGQTMLLPWVQQFVESVVKDDVVDDAIVTIRPDLDFSDIVCVAQRRGGRPTVIDRNVLARTIAELVESGEDSVEIAEWYAITPAQVSQATRYVRAHPDAA